MYCRRPPRPVGAARRPRRLVHHHGPLGEAVPDEHDAARAGRGAARRSCASTTSTTTDIEEIDAAWQRVEPFLAKHKVSTVVSAQASLPFALAVAAVRGKVGVDEFTDETVADPVIQAMIPRTVVHQDDELYAKVTNSMPGRVTVRTKDGRELTAEVLYPKGNPREPAHRGRVQGRSSWTWRSASSATTRPTSCTSERASCTDVGRRGRPRAALQPAVIELGERGAPAWA